MSRGLAFRRHVDQRAKSRAKKYLVSMTYRFNPELVANDDRRIGMHSRTRCTCSGTCCGNPRRHWGEPLMSEKRDPSVYIDD